MSEKTDFYVYLIFRPNGVPCYIGKGRGRRWLSHAKKTHNPTLRDIYAQAGGSLPVVKIFENLRHSEAVELEIRLIAIIGRETNGGPLINATNGGDGCKGIVYTQELRLLRSVQFKELAKLRKGVPNADAAAARRGKKASAETLERLRISHLGKKQSPETIEKRRVKITGLKRSAEFCARMKARKGEKRSEVARKNISLAKLGKKHSDAHKAAQSAAQTLRYDDQKEKFKHSARMTLWWAERRRGKEDLDANPQHSGSGS